MTQKRKLFLNIVLGMAVAVGLVNEVPESKMLAMHHFKTEIQNDGGMTILPKKETPMSIYYVSDDVIELTPDNKVKEVFTIGDYIATREGKDFIKGGDNSIVGTEHLISVPSNLQKDFYLEIKGSYEGKPVKIYSEPDKKAELSSNHHRPDTIKVTDMKLYNQTFFKVHAEDGTTWYVDASESDWKVKTDQILRLTGEDTKEVTSGVRNLTLDPSTRTNLSAGEIKKLVSGTNLEGIENAVVEAENKYGVNALFILAVAVNESGWGDSYLATDRNNLFGICAFDSNVDAASHFSSKGECVLYFGRLISKEYFAEGRTSLQSINDVYASNGNWGRDVGSIMSQFIGKL